MTLPAALRRPLPILLALAFLQAPGLGSETPPAAASPGPAFTAMRAVVRSFERDAGQPTSRIVLALRFYLTLDGVTDLAREVKEAKILHGDDAWVVKLALYSGSGTVVIGGSESFVFSGLSTVNNAILPLGAWRAEIKLSSGGTLARGIEILPPGEPPAGDGLWLHSEAYPDLRTPWHVPALASPRVSSAAVGPKDLEVLFAVDDRRVSNIYFEFYAKDRTLLATTARMVDGKTGQPKSFLNGGKPLRLDGSMNRLSFAKTSLRIAAGRNVDEIESVYAIAHDGLRYRGTEAPDRYAHIAFGPEFFLHPAPALASPGTTAAGHGPTPPIPASIEDDNVYFDWLTGLSGILSNLNGWDSRWLKSPLSEADLAGQREFLRAWWSVNGKADLLAAIDGLLTRGHNASYASCVRAIEADPALSDEEIAVKGDAATPAYRLALARRYKDEVFGRNILAWDLGRAAMLVRWGYYCGYLSADESWELLVSIGARAAGAYSSWQDFGASYILGRLFYAAPDVPESQRLFAEAEANYVKLMAPGGDWDLVPWKTGRERGP